MERAQRVLLLAPKRPRTMSRDHVRRGTITLCAAFDPLIGKPTTNTETRYSRVEWPHFLEQIDCGTLRALDLHLMVSDHATQRHSKIQSGLKRQPRITMQFMPTWLSWLNMVKRFFADLTVDVIRAGSSISVKHLVRDVSAGLADRNAVSKPYLWKARGTDILAKVRRARAAPADALAARVFGRELRVRTLVCRL